MSMLGIVAFTLAIIFAACMLGYAWGWSDAKALPANPPSAERV